MAYSYDELYGRAAQLLPALRERAAKCEELRRVPDDGAPDDGALAANCVAAAPGVYDVVLRTADLLSAGDAGHKLHRHGGDAGPGKVLQTFGVGAGVVGPRPLAPEFQGNGDLSRRAGAPGSR